MKTIVLIGLVLAISGVALARDLPEFIHVCKKNEPNLSECIKSSIINMKPQLKTGVPDYKIPSLEPLILKELVATAGGNIKLKLTNVIIHGASDFSLTKLKANLETLTFVADLDLPRLSLKGNYDVNGRIILLHIRGNGPMEGNVTNSKGFVKIQMKEYKKEDGESYLKVAEIKTKIFVQDGALHLQNLFGGDPVLGEAVNNAINSNFNGFVTEIKPALESAISNAFTDIANGILQQVPFKTLFPES
ncbi:hypothetical protein K0M31_012356 [Melipona bicolor]|uniref:Circadian clock-controlled protein n=1 Tax=Melipona bicolor TaxID=60889 RepID=A0AA40FJP7_9HYME|nr:hypothetical protein K0M31_012356 [Melipona bicolor]